MALTSTLGMGMSVTFSLSLCCLTVVHEELTAADIPIENAPPGLTLGDKVTRDKVLYMFIYQKEQSF
jgi:hypothetical protein